MASLLLWILVILGLLMLLLGILNPRRGGMSWAGFGLVLGLVGVGAAWLHRQFGIGVFWGLGILAIVLLVWALANLRRGRWAAWTVALAVLMGLAGFASISLLGSPSPNLLTNNTLPDPLNYFLPSPDTALQPVPDTTPTSPTPPSTPETPSQPAQPAQPGQPETTPPTQPETPEPNPNVPPDNATPAPDQTPLTPPSPAPTPTTPATSLLREAEPSCPCELNVSVNVPDARVTILKDGNVVVASSQQKSSFQLDSGDYTLQVEAAGYKTLSASINVPKNRNLEVELVK